MMSLLFRLGGTLDSQTDDALLGANSGDGSFASLLQDLQHHADQQTQSDFSNSGQLSPLAPPLAVNADLNKGEPSPLLILSGQVKSIDTTLNQTWNENPTINMAANQKNLVQVATQDRLLFGNRTPDDGLLSTNQSTSSLIPQEINNRAEIIKPNALPESLIPLTTRQNNNDQRGLSAFNSQVIPSPLYPKKISVGNNTEPAIGIFNNDISSNGLPLDGRANNSVLSNGVFANSLNNTPQNLIRADRSIGTVSDNSQWVTNQSIQATVLGPERDSDLAISKIDEKIAIPVSPQNKSESYKEGQSLLTRFGQSNLDTNQDNSSNTPIQQSRAMTPQLDTLVRAPQNSALMQPINNNNPLTDTLTNQQNIENTSLWQNPNGSPSDELLATDEIALRSAALIRSNMQTGSANINDMSSLSDGSAATLTSAGSSFTSALSSMAAQGSERSVNGLLNEAAEVSEAIEQAQLEQDDIAGETIKFGQDRREWSGALGQRIMTMVAQDIQQARIQLDPPELGALEIKLQVQQDQASVQIHAQHGQVREVLEQNIFRLKDALQQQGIELTDSEFTDDEFNQSEQNLANQESEQQDLSERSSALASTESDMNDQSKLDTDTRSLNQKTDQQGVINQQGRLDTFV